MFRGAALVVVLGALLSAIASLWLSSGPTPHSAPPISGRNNTVLYLTDSSGGLSNAHCASAFALLQRNPDVKIYWGSFADPPLEPRLRRISDAARVKNPHATPIAFHELGADSSVKLLLKQYPLLDDFITAPGLAGYPRMANILESLFVPGGVEEYFSIFKRAVNLIEEVDPAVVIVDGMHRPFMDAVRNSNRLHAIITPNALLDMVAPRQPWGAMFWKYPAMMSGHPFPVPLRTVLLNTWVQIRFIYTLIASPKVRAARTELAARGVKDPIKLDVQQDHIPLLSGDLPEAGLPLSFHPPNVTVCGPMVLDTAPAEEQDPDLFRWLEKGPPTMLICLGGNMRYNERRATILGMAVLRVLEETESQVLWKFPKEGEYDDAWRAPLEKYVANGRLRFERWLKVDPVSMANTGRIEVWVNHGGANCYYEAAISGVKQVILPVWADTYNFAQMAEYTGIGVWPGKELAPEWDTESLSEGFLTALKGEKAEAMQKNANAIKEAAKRYSGRDCAAEHIARMAGMGH